MDLTYNDAPSRKLIVLVGGAVIGLHVLTAAVLMMVKAPESQVESFAETPPIEIQLMSLSDQTNGVAIGTEAAAEDEALDSGPQAETETEVEVEAEPQAEPEPVPEAEPEPEIETEAAIEPEVKPEAEPEPEPEPEFEPIEPLVEPLVEPTVIEPQVEEVEPQPVPAIPEQEITSGVTTSTTTTIEKSAEATASGAASQSTIEESTPSYGGGYTAHSTIPTAPTSSSMAQMNTGGRNSRSTSNNSTSNNGSAAANNNDSPANASGISNEPVPFDESDASWAVAPRVSFPSQAKQGVKPGDTLVVLLTLKVNKQGGIDSVSLAQSSGNRVLDQAAQRQIKTGKLKPFMRDGVPVVGNVTLPIRYVVP